MEKNVEKRDEKIVNHPAIDPARVVGWGVDADPRNDPTYPMKKRSDAAHAGYSWERPPQQPVNIEVLHSNERPNVSATFGTSRPPAGLSGLIRRQAFRYSESSYGHWVPLILADRVGVVEGFLGDLAHGHIPNIPAEMGLKARWKHDRPKLLTQLFLGAVATAATIAYLRGRGEDGDGEQRERRRTTGRAWDERPSWQARQSGQTFVDTGDYY